MKMVRKNALDFCMLCSSAPCECYSVANSNDSKRQPKRGRKSQQRPTEEPVQVVAIAGTPVLPSTDPKRAATATLDTATRVPTAPPALIGDDDPPPPTFAQVQEQRDIEQLEVAMKVLIDSGILHRDSLPKSPSQRAAHWRADRWRAAH